VLVIMPMMVATPSEWQYNTIQWQYHYAAKCNCIVIPILPFFIVIQCILIMW